MKVKLTHEGTVIERVIKLAKSIEYYDEVIEPSFANNEAWVIKEHKQANKSELLEINNLADYLKENESFWNLELAHYNLTVTTFLAKYL